MEKKLDDQADIICEEFFAAFNHHVKDMGIKNPQLILALCLTQMVSIWAIINRDIFNHPLKDSLESFKKSLDLITDENFSTTKETVQ